MGRPRALIASGEAALNALIRWIHARLNEADVSYEDVARGAYCSRSSVSRALCGKRLPPWELVEAVAIRCQAEQSVARRLWDAADDSRRRRQARVPAGPPEPGIDSWQSLYRALGDLIVARAGSQRELVRRDGSGLLSTLGAVLRYDRSLSHEVLVRILAACEVSDTEHVEWMSAWERWGEPRRMAMDARRRDIARRRLQPRRYAKSARY